MRWKNQTINAFAIGATALSCCGELLNLQEPLTAATDCKRQEDCDPQSVCFEHTCLKACGETQECPEMSECDDGACIPAGESCLPHRRTCDGRQPLVCTPNRVWEATDDPCEVACVAGHCRNAPSCQQLDSCADSQSCCTSDTIPDGAFDLPFSVMDEAREVKVTVGAFALDRFEVTIGRYYRFLQAYDAWMPPKPGQGEAADTPSSGWMSEWSENRMLVPPNASSLSAGTSACFDWLSAPFDSPMRCVNWYMAMAFCIWDGGRLPTEREWTFAAMGGDMQRPFPWSEAPHGVNADRDHACFKDADWPCEAPMTAGSNPQGAGLWLTQDLSGNVSEWMLDEFREDLSLPSCRDLQDAAGSEPAQECAAPIDGLRVVKGGSYSHASQYVSNAVRSSAIAERRSKLLGFRCAYDIRE